MLISNGKAVGVEFLRNGRREIAGVMKEVILSAGPVGTPQILILSGVGPEDQLSDLKVKLKNCWLSFEGLNDYYLLERTNLGMAYYKIHILSAIK